MEPYRDLIILAGSFFLIALASAQIGRAFVRLNLPLISGFLLTGILAGPFVLDLISHEAIETLRFVEELCLVFIAFAAGSELYIREFRERLRSIAWVLIGLVVATFTLGVLAVFYLSSLIPFMEAMSPGGRLAVSLLAGAILVARSPSAAIAIINELRAKGPFTQIALGVTVIMDVVVIVLFAINSSIADALLTGVSLQWSLVLLIVAELVVSLLLALTVAALVRLILGRRTHPVLKTAMILIIGYLTYPLALTVRQVSHDRLGLEVLLEPLLISLIASFVVSNYTRYRSEFLQLLQDAGMPVYVAFFTLTGASLRWDVFLLIWPVALLLFGVRLLGIVIGSFAGGVAAREPMAHNRLRWMGFVTQAGVAIGLAQEVSVIFPEWGGAFATMIISLVVINETIGPPFFKWAIHRVGEAHTRAEVPGFDGVRDAIIFGLEGQSLALARQLTAEGWRVKVASRKARDMAGIDDSDVDIYPIAGLTKEALSELGAGEAEAIVCMLSDDENFQVCELAYEHFGTPQLIVRLNEPRNFERFHELGVLVVDPGTATVSLLDQFVRSPSTASLLLGMQEDQAVADIVMRNQALDGLRVRDLRLPLDTLIVSIRRNNHFLISHGYTRLEVGDMVSMVGPPGSLEEVTLRFEVQQ